MSSIVVEEVGIGTPNIIIAEPNLTSIVYVAPIPLKGELSIADTDVDLPEVSLSLDVDMQPPVTVMEAEDSLEESNECDMAETMNDEESEPIEYKPITAEPESLFSQASDTIINADRIVPTECENVVEQIECKEFSDETLVELSRYSWGTREPNYLRGCYWSPDGTCILTPVNKDGMHVVELPAELYAVNAVNSQRPLDILSSAVHVPENGTIYDCCWYPFMNSTSPESCCWISSQQHSPIQMWDAFDGKLRCSYRGYDAVDEVEAALSVSFSIDGASVIGGYRKSLKIFRTDTPGRDFTSFSLKSPASCLAVHQTQEDLLAIGSWNGTVALHDVRSPKLEVVDAFTRTKAGGITMLKFSTDGQKLFAGSRKDDVLACWDVRRSDSPLFEVRRTVSTNQRVQFDISSSGRWLASGDTDGLVRVWELQAEREGGNDQMLEYQFSLHNDCCNGVALHPSRPILATVSGQHHFDDNEVGDGLQTVEPKAQENSLIFWWYGNSYTNPE